MNPDLTMMSIFMFILGFLFGFATLAIITQLKIIWKNRKKEHEESPKEKIEESSVEETKEE